MIQKEADNRTQNMSNALIQGKETTRGMVTHCKTKFGRF